MIRLIDSKPVPHIVEGQSVDMALMRFVGLPADTKPTTSYGTALIANGSVFVEIGGSAYIYNEANSSWVIDDQFVGASAALSSQVIQLVTLITGNTPITRVEVTDAGTTTLNAEWDKEYVIPGTSLESLNITLDTAPTAVSSCIKITILGIHRHEDEDDNTLLLPPTIVLPEGLVIVGGYPEQEGDRWVLTIDNNLTATAMVIPNPPVEGDTEGET